MTPSASCIMSTLDAIARGVAASAVGTLAMDASLYLRYRRDGGDAAFAGWESSEGVVSWEDAPAPARVAKRLLEGVLKRDVPPRYARALNNATHWAFGLAAGAGYGFLLGRGMSRRSRTASPSAPRCGPADTSSSHSSASTSRSGSTTSRRSART